MKRSRLALLALLAATASVIAGCVVSPAIAYPKPKLPLDEIAVFKGAKDSPYGVFFTSVADLAAGEKLEWIHVGGAFLGYPRETHVLPGRYAVMLYCATGGGYAFPVTEVEANAGVTYEFACAPVEGNRVRAYLMRSDATPLPPAK